MRKNIEKTIVLVIISIGIIGFLNEDQLSKDETSALAEQSGLGDVPDWFKSVASFWSEDEISTQEFLDGVEFLIGNNVIVVEGFEYAGAEEIAQIKPDEMKSVATIKIPEEENTLEIGEPTEIAPKPFTGLVTPIHTELVLDPQEHYEVPTEEGMTLLEQEFFLTNTATIYTIGSIETSAEYEELIYEESYSYAAIVLKVDGEEKAKKQSHGPKRDMGNWVDFDSPTLVPVWTGKLEPGKHIISVEIANGNTPHTRYCMSDFTCSLSTLIFE